MSCVLAPEALSRLIGVAAESGQVKARDAERVRLQQLSALRLWVRSRPWR